MRRSVRWLVGIGVIGVVLLGSTPTYAANTAADLADPAPEPFVPLDDNCAWLAIRASSAPEIAKALGLRSIKKVPWSVGLKRACGPDASSHDLLIGPPIDGWTVVVGVALFEPMTRYTAPGGFATDLGAFITDLSKQLKTEVQYFANKSPEPLSARGEHHAWGRALEGRLGIVKHCWINPTDDEIHVQAEGRDPARDELHKDDFGFDCSEDIQFPHWMDVMKVAGKWSINPSGDRRIPSSVGPGYVGHLAAGIPRHE